MNILRKRNEELEKLVGQLGTQSSPSSLSNLAGLADEVTLSGTYFTSSGSGRSFTKSKQVWEYKIKWEDLFALIAPYLLEHPNDSRIKSELEKSVFGLTGTRGSTVSINDQIYQTVKIQLVALGLVETRYAQTTGGGMALFWSLTKIGQEQLFRSRTIKKEKTT